MNLASELHNHVSAVCPIDGISIGKQSDPATWRIQFREGTTDPQKAAAEAAKLAFNLASYNQAQADKITRRAAVKTDAEADTFIDRLRSATPAQINTFVSTNVNNLADAKVFLAKLAVAVAYSLSGGSEK